MAKNVHLAVGQTECDEPVECPFFTVDDGGWCHCQLSDKEVRFVNGARRVTPKGRYERPSWCELPATVWAG